MDGWENVHSGWWVGSGQYIVRLNMRAEKIPWMRDMDSGINFMLASLEKLGTYFNVPVLKGGRPPSPIVYVRPSVRPSNHQSKEIQTVFQSVRFHFPPNVNTNHSDRKAGEEDIQSFVVVIIIIVYAHVTTSKFNYPHVKS